MSKPECIILLLFLWIATTVNRFAIVHVESSDHSQVFNGSYATQITTPLANGCYKERIIEQDLWNSKRVFETEKLICPPGVNASTFAMLMQQLQMNNTANYTTHFMPTNNTPTAVPTMAKTTTYMNYPYNFSYAQNSGTNNFNVLPYASHPVGLIQQQPSAAAVNPSNATSHVAYVLKKSGFYDREKKKSSANSLNSFNYFLMFVVITIFFN